MRHRTTMTALALAAAGLLLAGCGATAKPAATTPPVAATTSAVATPDKATLIKACVTAIAAGKDNATGGAAECNSLPKADYYEALHEANVAALKKFNDDTNGAASATP